LGFGMEDDDQLLILDLQLEFQASVISFVGFPRFSYETQALSRV